MAGTVLRGALAAIVALKVISAPAAAVAASPEISCDLAAAQAERDWNIPPGILSAVGTVESGRSGRTGRAPWPWTINAAGRGSFHDSKGDAVATVLAIMIRGFPYIDVGCFQVDIAYHAGVFASIDEAFDPEKNAQVAAKILLAERSRAPDWESAVARYHSATPSLGSAYLNRVRNALPSAKIRALSAQLEATVPPDATHDPAPKPAPGLPGELHSLPVVIYGRTPTGRSVQPQLIRLSPPPSGSSPRRTMEVVATRQSVATRIQ